MADHTIKAPAAGEPATAQLLPPGVQPPPTMNASHLVVAVSPVEVSVMLGHTRMMPVQQEAGISGAQLVEWFATLTLSPMTARQLRDGLNTALETYEKQFGLIPKAPAAQPKK